MNDQSKYWTRLERYTPTDNSLRDWDGDSECIWHDIEALENFTLSEKQWLHKNLNKKSINNGIIKYENEQRRPIAISFNSDIDFQTAVIGFKAKRGLGYCILFKHKDDWFYCVALRTEAYAGKLYKCDGFLGLKKLLEHLDLLK